MKKKLFFISLFIILVNSLHAKVLIISHHFNRPDFIEWQYKTFKKFILDDYEFVVFNDAKGYSLSEDIQNVCHRLNIRCIRIPQEVHNRPYMKRLPFEDYNHPCVRCANVVQYSLDVLGFYHNDIVMIIDSDMFMIKPFSPRTYLGDHDIAAVEQSRNYDKQWKKSTVINYIWNGIILFNMPKLPNRNTMCFNCGIIDNTPVDAGGYMHYYFKNNPSVTVKHINGSHYSENLSFPSFPLNILNSKYVTNIELFLDDHIIHYRGGGNWDNKPKEYHEKKSKIFNNFINKLTE